MMMLPEIAARVYLNYLGLNRLSRHFSDLKETLFLLPLPTRV
jgi:hypothetical protein